MFESDIKRKMVKAVKAEGGYARRLEDRFAVGLPDMIVVFPGTPVFFIEVKKFDHLSFEPTPRQLAELKAMNISYSTDTAVVGYKDGKYYICAPKETISVTDCVFTMRDETFPQTLRRWYDGKATKNEDNRGGGQNLK